MKPMYTTHAAAYAEAITDNAYNAHYERPSTLALVGKVTRDMRVLDLACGPGEYADYFATHGAQVTAIDISPQMVAITDKRTKGHVCVYQQDLTQGLPSEQSGMYDLVVCPLAIHYLYEIAPLFSEVRRVLKPNGRFVFSTHHPLMDFVDDGTNNYFAVEQIEEEWNTIGAPVKVSFYRRSLTDIFVALAQTGLVVETLSEGTPDEQLKQIDEPLFHKLTRSPNFLFIKARPNQ